MTEFGLKRLLESRHADDLFVPGCKNGPTSAAGRGPLRIMDGWALLSTWSPATCVGYEIKVSRGDWLRDQKWESYLPLCHLFSFVTPKGLIKPEEIPPGIGLLEAIGAGTGARLVTRKKPTRRAIEWPVDLMIYVLMSRVQIRTETERTREQRLADARRWLDTKTEDGFKGAGHRVGAKVRNIVEKMRIERDAAIRRSERFEHVERALVSMGLDPRHCDAWGLERRMREAELAPLLRHALANAESLASSLKRLHEQATKAVGAEAVAS